MCDFSDDVLEMIRHRPHQVQYIYIVWKQRGDLGSEKVVEALNKEVAEGRNVPVFAEVTGERGEEAVGRGLAVESPHHLCFVDGALLFKVGGDAFGKFASQVTLNEQFAEVGAAAFVAEQVTKGGRLGNDAAAIVEARACAGAEDGHHAALSIAEQSARPHEVRNDFDVTYINIV